MKIAIVVSVALTCIIFIECGRTRQAFTFGTRFRSVECGADNYSNLVNFCYIKAISRRVTTLNLHLITLKPAYKPIYIQMILSYRYGNIYREVIDTKKIEWCEIMEGVKAHLFLMQTIRMIDGTTEKAFHKCPYQDDLLIQNLTLDDSKAFDTFPQGTYKYQFLAFNKTYDLNWHLNVTIDIKSPIKESMG